MDKNPVVYMDADIILHRAVAFCEDEFDGADCYDLNQGLRNFNGIRDRWLESMEEEGITPKEIMYVYSSGGNFRHDIYKDYKANRKGVYKKPVLKILKDELLKDKNAISHEGLEADDLIGMFCSIKVQRDTCLAVSADKDFKTVPLNLFIPPAFGKPHQFLSVTEEEANYNWMIQTLTGDTTDNYKGIEGIGIKKAEKILGTPSDLKVMWSKVVAAYQHHKQSDYLVMARLARILRAGDYNFETKEVKLWTMT